MSTLIVRVRGTAVAWPTAAAAAPRSPPLALRDTDGRRLALHRARTCEEPHSWLLAGMRRRGDERLDLVQRAVVHGGPIFERAIKFA